MKILGNFYFRLALFLLGILLIILLALFFLFLVGLNFYFAWDIIQNWSRENIIRDSVSIAILFIVGLVILTLGIYCSLNIFTDIKNEFFPKRCDTCGLPAYDMLTADKKIGNFCRKHLTEKYSYYFRISPFNVVLVEYQPKGISSSAYLYYPVSEIDFRSRYSNSDDIVAQQTVRHLLDVIKTKKCWRCTKQASILFVNKEVSPFRKYRTTPRKEFEQKGEYFCKEHALDKIMPAIQSSSKHFDIYEGLCLPHKEDGYQATVAY